MLDTGTIKSVALGSDHAGFELKEHIEQYLKQRGYEVIDYGTHTPESVDYPEFAALVARRVADGSCWRGVIVDGAGIGSAMVANKVPGVRAALCYDVSTARNSREHNDANVLTLGAGSVGTSLAEQILDVWLTSECTAERHLRRVAMMSELEQGGLPTPQPQNATTGCPAAAPGNAQISEADIERIVARVAELGAGGVGGSCDLTGLFCRVCTETRPENVRQLLDAGATRVGHRPGQGTIPTELAQYIDHTLLKADATVQAVLDLCSEDREYCFASVCVNPIFVETAAKALAGCAVDVCTVVGFPLGAHHADVKAMETRRAIREGAREIDMVISIGALKSGDCDWVCRDIRAVTEACLERGVICKVILETALLTDEEKIVACRLARKARADFVKTSTGFGPGGATAHDVALMRDAVRDSAMGVKASGGIKTLGDAEKMIAAGATRIGASASVKIMKEARGVTVSD
jgi:deoxyribose-phosphate aldolase